MIGDRRVLALVPARSGSKGLPGKNVRMLHGKPLLAWPIAAARASAFVDEVVISTDSAEFAEIAKAHGARAPFLRPAELASDSSPSIDFVLHAIDSLAAAGETFDILVLLEPTSPLTDGGDVDAALTLLDRAAGGADAVVGVTPMVTNHPAYAVRVDGAGLISPYGAPDFSHMPRRQDLEPLYCLDGSLYVSTVDALRRERGFCHSRTLAYQTARHKAYEVDDLVDFICVEAISRNLNMLEAEAGDAADPAKR